MPFSKSRFLIVLPIELPIVLPIVLPVVLPIVLPIGLPIGLPILDCGQRACASERRGNFMHFKYNFSLDTAKRMLKPFVHTSFSIRVFWLR